LLRVSLRAYRWPRRLTYLGAASRPLFPQRGIAAGSTTATYELWAILKPAVDRLTARIPRIVCCLHVDDLCITSSARQADDVIHTLLDTADEVKETIQTRLGMPFARDKGFVIASSQEIAVTVAGLLPIPAAAATTVRRLGIDYSLLTQAGQAPPPQDTVRLHRLAQSLRYSRRIPGLFEHGAPVFLSVGYSHGLYTGQSTAQSAPPMWPNCRRRRSNLGNQSHGESPPNLPCCSFSHPSTRCVRPLKPPRPVGKGSAPCRRPGTRHCS
jgi:hypothetical protein